MTFGYTILYVKDVEASISFYEKAFRFQRKFITPEGDYGELITGETTLSFASMELGKANIEGGVQEQNLTAKPLPLELAFVTQQLEADFNHAIENGATLVKPITAKPWGQQVGYVRDINGFLIEMCTPVQS